MDLIEDPEKRRLDAAVLYWDSKQKPGQSTAAFDSYLMNLDYQLSQPYIEG
jgi:hypothetical protein